MAADSQKVGLVASVVWSLFVWWLGEGLGGVLAGPVSLLAGFPGAVLLYAVIAVLVWPSPAKSSDGAAPRMVSVAETSPLRSVAAKAIWLLLWATAAFETLRPASRGGAQALSSMIRGAAKGEPSWLSGFNDRVAADVAGHAAAGAVVLAALCVAVALGVLIPGLRRAGVVLAVVLAVAIWVIGQDFGAIATGTGTDPNTGLPLVVLALCFWPARTPGPGAAASAQMS